MSGQYVREAGHDGKHPCQCAGRYRKMCVNDLGAVQPNYSKAGPKSREDVGKHGNQTSPECLPSERPDPHNANSVARLILRKPFKMCSKNDNLMPGRYESPANIKSSPAPASTYRRELISDDKDSHTVT